jgi:cell division protein FtsW
MVFDTTSAEVLDRALDRSMSQVALRQLSYGVFASILALCVYKLGYQTLVRLSGPLLLLISFLLLLILIPGIGVQINGARRWMNVGGISFQPSELAKLLIPLYYIKVVAVEKKSLSFFPFLKLMLLLAIPLGLILIEPDNGTVAICLATLCMLFILTRVRWTYWVLPLGVLTLCGSLIALQMSHVPDRIRIYLHPELDLKGKGHQPHQAKIAAGSGGLLGRGIGESMQKMSYLPEARSDYIAAIFAEECGFIGILVLILLYLLIGGMGFALAASARDLQGFYIATIMTFLICFQAFLNLGVVSGLLPSKGTNLPFFSHGGSSLIANFLCLGAILSVGKSVPLARKT